MSAGDLIVLAPWMLFGAGITVIGARLLAARRARRARRR